MTAVVADARRFADMHALYRMFDEGGRLLYVGITGNLATRLAQHEVKRWYPLIKTICVEWFPHEAAARLAEKRVIATERPRYNVADTGRRKRPIELPTARKAKPDRDVLRDVLQVFGGERGLHWAELAERLSEQIPSRWADASADVVSVQCRTLGVPSAQVKSGGRNRNGCRRSDVERMVRERRAAS